MGWFWAYFSLGIGVMGAYLTDFLVPVIGEYATLWVPLLFMAAGTPDVRLPGARRPTRDGPLAEAAWKVHIGVHTVGIYGSDVHYFTHGRIGPYVVEQPMVLGHEASGTVLKVGEGVDHLAVGERVCMEPDVPNPRSRAARLGRHNVDPDVQF